MSTKIDSWNEDTGNSPSFSQSNLIKKLPDLLRLIGAAAVVIAMYSFLAKGWQNGNDTFRYLMMLGHSGALAAIGLASGHWLKEGKGARLLLGLALVSVPANFAILGAFIFSQSTTAQATNYPDYVAWSVDSMQTALMTSAGAMVLLIPIIFLGFVVLARSMSKKLSILFLLSNAALLIPLRDPNLISLLIVALVVTTIFMTRRAASGHSSAKTQEGMTALSLQFLPLAVLLGRSLWLYAADLFLLAVLAATLFFALRQVGMYLAANSKLHGVLNLLSTLSAFSTGLLLSAALFESHILADAIIFPLSSVVSAIILIELSTRTLHNTRFYHRLAVSALGLGLIANLILFGNLLAALACFIIGMATSFYGFKNKQRSLFIGGISISVVGLAHQTYQALHMFDLGSWAILAGLGIASIVIASTIESEGGKIKSRITALKQKLHDWEN